MPNPSTVLALDVGTRRIGVAVADSVARLARPLTTLQTSDQIFREIVQLTAEHGAAAIVVGLPRGLDGQTTRQTELVETFVRQLKHHLDIPVHLQDEALTSVQAEAELSERTNRAHQKADVDALAASYILEDFLKTSGAAHG